MMLRHFDRTDRALWSIIAVYTGLIYATLSIVSRLRIWLAERFGPEVWDAVYWLFALIGLGLLVSIVRRHRGRELLRAVAALGVVAALYAYYLSSMHYAVERIHFLQYGLLGALVYAALRRHQASWVAMAQGAALVYWIGLGDEAVQWALPNRVGEIGDGVINLFSGALGIAAAHFTVLAAASPRRTTRTHIDALFASAALTTVGSALFLLFVHGFGHVIETKDPGRLFSAFRAPELSRIDKGEVAPDGRRRRVYENEAIRHLHQREFYFTNDFAIRGGGYYRSYDRCHLENRILQTYYRRFLDRHGPESAGKVLASLDAEIAAKSMGRPVRWPDSLSRWVEEQAGKSNAILESRVKSTIITEYRPADLWFYVALILFAVAYGRQRLRAYWPRRAPVHRSGAPEERGA